MMTSTNPRREAGIIAIFTILGAILRLWNFNRLGLTHFDEGIYAFKGLWSLTPDGLWSLDRELIAYAPPLYPILIGVGYWILPWGMSDLSAIFVSTACGIAAIPVVGWLGRRSFGAGAGAAASAFASLAGPHIAFSRMALTDAPFLLFWLIAIAFGMRFLEKPGAWRAIVFGLAVGLAQNVKYNGWLAGIIVAATVCWNLAIGQGIDRKTSLRTLRFGMIAVLVAALVYLPWFWFAQTHGGYADLIRHQRSFTRSGFWLSHLKVQLAQWIALSGGMIFPSGAWLLGWTGAAIASRDRSLTRSIGGLVRWNLIFVLGITLCAAVPYLPWWISLAALPWLAIDFRSSVRLIAFWWIATSAVTPIYYPYARLWLPVQAATWIIFGGMATRLIGWISSPNFVRAGSTSQPKHCRRRRLIHLSWIGACSVAFAAAGIEELVWRPLPGLLAPTDDLRSFVQQTIIAELKKRGIGKVRVFARPCVTFYLRTGWNGEILVLPDFNGWTADTDRLPMVNDVSIAHYPGDLTYGVGRNDKPLLSFEDLKDPTLRPGGIFAHPSIVDHYWRDEPAQFTSLPNLLDWTLADRLILSSGEPDPRTFNKSARVRLDH